MDWRTSFRVLLTISGALLTDVVVAQVIPAPDLVFTLLGANAGIAAIIGSPYIWTFNDTTQGNVIIKSPSLKARSLYYDLTYDYKTNNLFWNDLVTKTIVKQAAVLTLQANTSSTQLIYQNPVSNITGIAVDWYTGNVYFSDGNSSTIGLTSSDGRNLTMILVTGSANVQNPSGLAIDPDMGLMFWIQRGQSGGSLSRATMAGKSVTQLTVQSAPLTDPQAITLDLTSMVIYWANHDSLKIGSCDYNGNNHRSFAAQDPTQGGYLGVAVFGTFLFATWPSPSSGNIDFYNITSGTYIGNFYYDLETPLRAIYISSTTLKPHQCSTLNCEQLCVNGGNGTGTCVCLGGFPLQPDGRSCTPTNNPTITTTKMAGEGSRARSDGACALVVGAFLTIVTSSLSWR